MKIDKTRTDISPLANSSLSERVFDYFNIALMFMIFFFTVYPFLHIIAMSFSSVSKIGLSIIPVEPTLSSYMRVIRNPLIWIGYKNTLIRVTAGTSMSLIFIIMTAYPLSKKDLPFRKIITIFIIFTMFFKGGMIPEYLLVKELNLMNTYWALLLPRLIDTFAVIVMRNFFMTLPDSIEESAQIDGASYFTVLFRIIIPISLPIIATVVLWRAVWHWNQWFDALIYIQDYSKTVLQIVLRDIVIEGTQEAMNFITESAEYQVSNPDIVKAATVIFSTFPILCVYPFIQKYFVKGIVMGAEKG